MKNWMPLAACSLVSTSGSDTSLPGPPRAVEVKVPVAVSTWIVDVIGSSEAGLRGVL